MSEYTKEEFTGFEEVSIDRNLYEVTLDPGQRKVYVVATSLAEVEVIVYDDQFESHEEETCLPPLNVKWKGSVYTLDG